jgi:CelD/BcsL family acetyltransferase involved in cellulose biosynthesis
MVEVIEVNDIEELSQYRMVWNALFPGTPNATFFHTFDWLETYWRHFGRGQKLRVLIVYAAGEPIGILPLCVRKEAYRLNNVRVLTYPLDNWTTWYGPIGPNPASTMMAAMQHIRQTPRDWDMLELRWVADEDTAAGKSARALRIAGMFSAKSEYQWTSLVDLTSGWDAYLASKSHQLRRLYRSKVRDLFDTGRAEYIRHRPQPAAEGDGDPRRDLYEQCESVARFSWQSTVDNGNTITHERVRDYFRDAHAAASRIGMSDMHVLALDGEPAAFLYGYQYAGHVTALRTGFNAANDNGIGSALMLQVIRDSCQRGDRVIDLGPGERESKRRLRTRTESTYRLTYMPLDSWRSQAVRLSRWAKRRWPRRAAAV